MNFSTSQRSSLSASNGERAGSEVSIFICLSVFQFSEFQRFGVLLCGSLAPSDTQSWEPPDAVKGDIARSLFYMDIHYDGDAPNEPDLKLTMT